MNIAVAKHFSLPPTWVSTKSAAAVCTWDAHRRLKRLDWEGEKKKRFPQTYNAVWGLNLKTVFFRSAANKRDARCTLSSFVSAKGDFSSMNKVQQWIVSTVPSALLNRGSYMWKTKVMKISLTLNASIILRMKAVKTAECREDILQMS